MVQEAGRLSQQERWQKDEGTRAVGDGASVVIRSARGFCARLAGVSPQCDPPRRRCLSPELLGWSSAEMGQEQGQSLWVSFLPWRKLEFLVAAAFGSTESTPARRASRLGVPRDGLGIGVWGILESLGWKTRGAWPSSPPAVHGSPLSNHSLLQSLQITSVSCEGHLFLH